MWGTPRRCPRQQSHSSTRALAGLWPPGCTRLITSRSNKAEPLEGGGMHDSRLAKEEALGTAGLHGGQGPQGQVWWCAVERRMAHTPQPATCTSPLRDGLHRAPLLVKQDHLRALRFGTEVGWHIPPPLAPGMVLWAGRCCVPPPACKDMRCSWLQCGSAPRCQ